MVRRNAGASRIQVAPDASRTALSRFHRRSARPQPGTRAARRAAYALLNLGDLTVVILTRDEERNLPAALASLPAGTAILVVDAESSDRTTQIARDCGAAVIVRRWTDFVEARRFALGQVRTRWTFMLDADERLDPGLRAALANIGTTENACDGYVVRRDTYFCGRALHAMGWSGERLLRMVRTERAEVEANPVVGGSASLHERLRVRGAVGTLRGRLIHDSYPDLASYQRKFELYTDLESEGLHEPRRGLALRAVSLLAPFRFLWLLLARGGIFAGWRGIYIAFFSAWYPVVVHAKAIRRRRARSERKR